MAAAASPFAVTITAVDRATATIRKINDAVAKTARPFEEVGKSFKSLGREIGIDKIGKNLQKMGTHARDAAKGIGNIVGPLTGITGIATVAGIVHLADSWANLGRSITYTSRNIGIGTTQLQQFQGAARLAGLSGDAMGQSLESLGDTMEDAVYGRNQQALLLFDQLTGGVKRNKNGTMDVADEYKALAAKIYSYKGNPQLQRVIAKQFGLTSMLPLIQQGPKAMQKYMAELKKIGAIMTPAQIASANKFSLSLMEIEAAGNGLKYSIGNALIPAMKPLVDELSTWIGKNRDLISTDIGKWARDFASWVETINWKKVGGDIHTFIEDIDKVVNALGGMKGILIEIAGIKVFGWAAGLSLKILQLKALTKALTAARVAAAADGAAAAAGGGAADAVGGGIIARIGAWAAGLFGAGTAAATAGVGALLYSKGLGGRRRADGTYEDQLSNDQLAANAKAGRAKFNQRRIEAMAYFMSPAGGGWTRAQAAGIVGNLVQESTLRPNATNGSATGLAQWIGNRAKLFQQVEGVPLMGAKFSKQLDFINWELHHSEGKAGRALAQTENPANAAMAFGILDERFGNDGSLPKRMMYAREAYDATAAVGPYTAKAAAATPAVVSGKLHLDVNVTSSGTTVKATPGANTTAGVRVSHSTVGEAA